MREKTLEYADIALFAQIAEGDLKALLSCLGAFRRQFRKGEVILPEHKDVPCIGVVLGGTVHMLKEDIWGRQTLLTYITPGGLFGESFAVRKETRSYVTCLAGSGTEVLFLPARRIVHSCPRRCSFHAQLTQNMFDMLGQKSLMLMEKIEVSSKTALRDKILAYLSLQAQKQGSRQVKVPLSRSDMAEYLGVNRSAMTRELGAMRKEGLLEFEGDVFSLPPQEAVQRG